MGSFILNLNTVINWRLSIGRCRAPKRTTSSRFIKLGLSLLFVFNAGNIIGQNNMLIRKLSGKEIQRLSYDKEGKLESKEVFLISKLDSSQGVLSVKMDVQLFNKEGKLAGSYISTYKCQPDKSDLLLTVIPLSANKNTKYVVQADTYNFKSLYYFPDKSAQLNDVRLTVYVKSGALGFFGSKNKITISNRKLIQKEQNYMMQSRLTINTFLLGIRIKSIHYQVVENLSGDKSLVSQKFTMEDGSYFTINYINNF